MAERKESSVLFQLNELRDIEKQRVDEEERARLNEQAERERARLEAEERRLAEERAAQEAVERAERERVENEQRRLREEQLRAEAAMRLASVEEEARVEQVRLSQEMNILESRASKARPVALSVLAIVLLCAVGGLTYFLIDRRAQAAEAERAYQARLDTVRTERDGVQAELDELLGRLRSLRDKRIAASLDEVPLLDKELAALGQKIIDKKAELRAVKNKLTTP